MPAAATTATRFAPSASQLALVLPVAPTLALKSGVLAGAGVSAAGAGGAAGTAVTGSLAAKTLVGVALVGGGAAAVDTVRDRSRPAREGAAPAPVVGGAPNRPAATVVAPAPGAVPTTVPAAGGASEATPKEKEKKRKGAEAKKKEERASRDAGEAARGGQGSQGRRRSRPRPTRVASPTPKALPKASERRGPKAKTEPVTPANGRTPGPKANTPRGPKEKVVEPRAVQPLPEAADGRAKATPDRPPATLPLPGGRD